MILCLLILIPVVFGLICFTLGGNNALARSLALIGSVLTFVVACYVSAASRGNDITFSQQWLPDLGSQFSLLGDGLSSLLCMLTGIVVMVVMISQMDKEVEKAGSFYGFMLLAQAGLMGVFLASDALVFYFFWELALIPVYFLCSRWGGEKRIQATFKFFIYTFIGSLMMLSALIYLSMQTPGMNSYAWNDIVRAGSSLPADKQMWLFWLMFIAFAIKMPIFPFHTWQPDTYEQAPTPVTIILSALMVKMGLFALLRWLLPTLPQGVAYWSDVVVGLCIVGIVYASLLAIAQTDIKRIIAYSSIAHMGLMCAATFSHNNVGIHGTIVQMFNHGIIITGLWLTAGMAERRWGSRDISKHGGMAGTAPKLAIVFILVALANIGLLPLTSGFVGDFMLYNGLMNNSSHYHIAIMVTAGLGIILGAVYTLNMVQKTAYGNATAMIVSKEISMNEYLGLAIIICIMMVLGVYPKPLLDMTSAVSSMIVK